GEFPQHGAARALLRAQSTRPKAPVTRGRRSRHGRGRYDPFREARGAGVEGGLVRNLESKTFEVLDRMTFIPVVATRIASIDPRDCVLLARAGFRDPDTILLCYLSSGKATYDPYAWGD